MIKFDAALIHRRRGESALDELSEAIPSRTAASRTLGYQLRSKLDR
jgi:hypothetical protein